MNVKNKTIITLLLILFNITGIAWLQQQTIQSKFANFTNIDKDYYQREDQARKIYIQLIDKLPLLGFDNLIVDWLFLDFIQYYGDYKAREATDYSLAPEYFATIVERYPRFIQAYPFLEPATTLFALQPEKSNEIIAQGLKQVSPDIPYSPQLWIMKAINQILFLNDTDGALESYRQAVAWAKQDRDIYTEEQIKRLEETVTFLESKPDARLISASAWAGLLRRARDERTKQKILDYLEEIGTEVTITPTRISVKMKEE